MKFLVVIISIMLYSAFSCSVKAETRYIQPDGSIRIFLNQNDEKGERVLLTQDVFRTGDKYNRTHETTMILVIQTDVELAEDITIPPNCVLEFEGGNIIGNYNVYLGENCKIIGHGIEEIRLGGALYLNQYSYIENVNLVRNTRFSKAEDSFIIISDEYIKTPFNCNKKSNKNIRLDNVIISYPINKHKDYGNAIEIVSGNGNNKDNSFYRGMYNISFSKVFVNGYFNRAFYIHALEDGWITSLTFDNCFVERCTYGWKIDSDSPSPVGQVIINNSGMQNYDWTYYAVDCGNAELYIKHFRTYDWWNNHNVGSPYRFTDETKTTIIDVVYGSRHYDLDSKENQFNNNVRVQNWVYDRDIEKILDLKHGFVKLSTLYTLPNGTYRVPQDKQKINALGIDAKVYGGTMVVTGGTNEKLLFFVGNYIDKNRIVATLAFDRAPSSSGTVNYDSWTYSVTTANISGRSSERPKYTNETWSKGLYFFDSDLGKPIWWTGAYWVDATGAKVE